ncbi:hypothetical protein IU436_00330 [Nocardia farcinica]|uniref:hypothetical protein n=1 Tax=Nocardia farcinica TaxID=37329 RepID=UPI0018961B5F|nr:hypothetical protein [Nocardia farcinica]MBF6250273.1 hypothetical protein [Nocardia farcinica]MBF6266402.1 hypothetical protein [Nocardia farcinica]MBF6359912.1 hypothetical protein [Nocardia farcinica]MBF6382563.1 hypothetical protein [Nocardia farcinica]MBF6417702.1 hypothetical protein [Nocardia farcinica]
MEVALGIVNSSVSVSAADDRQALIALARTRDYDLAEVLLIDDDTFMPTAYIAECAGRVRAVAILAPSLEHLGVAARALPHIFTLVVPDRAEMGADVVGARRHTDRMGYEAVRAHSRRGRIGGSYVKGSLRFRDRPAPRRGRNRSPHFHGHRSASPMPILWVLGVLVGGVLLLLVVLTLTHMGPADRPDETEVVPGPVAPAQQVAPPQPCFPFEANC